MARNEPKPMRPFSWTSLLQAFSPVLMFGRSSTERFWAYLSQVGFTVGLFTLGSSFLLPQSGWALGIQTVSGVLVLSGLIGFIFLCTEDDLFHEHKELRGSIREACRDALVKDGNIVLSHYIHPQSYSKGQRDIRYLNSLSPRHVRWIRRQYKRAINREIYNQTKGVADTDVLIAAIDDVVDKDAVKKAAEDIKTLSWASEKAKDSVSKRRRRKRW